MSAAPDITVEPIDHDRWPADPGHRLPNLYIRVELDLATRTLRIVADPNHHGPIEQGYEDQPFPESWVHHHEFPVPMPAHMTWPIKGHLTADQAERLIAVMAPHARVICDERVPVTGRAAGGYDWSLRTAAAVRAIDAFASNWWHSLDPNSVVGPEWTERHEYSFPGLLAMPDALAATPELEDGAWAAMHDAALDEAAAHLARFAPYDLREQWITAAHLSDHDLPRSVPIYLVGVMATLYERRAELAGDLEPCDESEWFAQNPARLNEVDDSTTDEELSRLIEAEERAAAAAGKRLLGAGYYLVATREQHRERVRAELDAAAQTAEDLGERKKQADRRRSALLLRVDSWDDPADGEEHKRNAELARRARISRQAVRELRNRAAGTDGVEMASDQGFQVGQQVRNKRTGALLIVDDPADFDSFHYEPAGS